MIIIINLNFKKIHQNQMKKICHDVEGANQQTLSNATNDDNMHYCGYLFS